MGYNEVMKKFFKLFFVLLAVFLTTQICFAEEPKEYKILVLPDSLNFSSTNYYAYPDTSIIFASDIINNLKRSGKVQTVSMTQVRDTFRKDLKLQILAKSTLKEFKYNYNVGFVDLKRLTHRFGTNKVLIVTSSTDVQNYVLRRTVWDFLNIPGATVIDPAYKLSSYAVLVDVDNEEVLWQKIYHKNISSRENRMIPVNFAPAAEQLEKIKSYSEYFIAPEIAQMVEFKILPQLVIPSEEKIIEPNAILSVQSKIEKNVGPEIKVKPFTPTKPRAKANGTVINDL